VFDLDHEKGLTLRKCNLESSFYEIREKTVAEFEWTRTAGRRRYIRKDKEV
jgi:hypothetical protein